LLDKGEVWPAAVEYELHISMELVATEFKAPHCVAVDQIEMIAFKVVARWIWFSRFSHHQDQFDFIRASSRSSKSAGHMPGTRIPPHFPSAGTGEFRASIGGSENLLERSVKLHLRGLTNEGDLPVPRWPN
jgi:hypothetical protein